MGDSGEYGGGASGGEAIVDLRLRDWLCSRDQVGRRWCGSQVEGVRRASCVDERVLKR
jgi:hypothetical protein